MIKGLSERTVDRLVKNASLQVSWDCLASLVQERAILTDNRRTTSYLSGFSLQRVTAVNQVRRAEILARVDRIARGEPTGKAAAEPLDQAGKASAERTASWRAWYTPAASTSTCTREGAAVPRARHWQGSSIIKTAPMQPAPRPSPLRSKASSRNNRRKRPPMIMQSMFRLISSGSTR